MRNTRQLVRNIASNLYNWIASFLGKWGFSLPANKGKSNSRANFNQSISYPGSIILRFTFPSTYRKLIALELINEYSMGYGSINGFRASIAHLYYWYDLRNEEKTKLHIHPFCFMDANSYYEQKASAEAAFEELMQYYKVIQVCKWHYDYHLA